MCKILLSINPEHVANILNGSKKVEYRKVTCRCDVDKILVYSTSPVMKVVGEAAVLGFFGGFGILLCHRYSTLKTYVLASF